MSKRAGHKSPAAKKAVGREAARRQGRGGRKTKLDAAAKEPRAKAAPKLATPKLATPKLATPPLATKPSVKPSARPSVKPPARIEARVEAEAHGREYARMNERELPKRVQRAVERGNGSDVHQPRYLSETARVVIRKLAKVAYTPVAIARAVVDRFRDRE
jgi:hypothetical protein